MANLEKEVRQYQVDLFQMLGEFFGRATGLQPLDFASIENFPTEIRKNAQIIAHRGEDAFKWADQEFRRFYAERGAKLFGTASRLGGLRLVMGGSSRFLRSHLSAAKGALLYSDTVLIPDPVLPWLERTRKEERFPLVLMLQAVHALLHLRPIVDAGLPHCPVIVFPSWEKSLEENDPQTIKSTFQLLADVLARYVDPGITSMDDAAEFIRKNPEDFLRAAERAALFVAPGGLVGEPIMTALTRYETHAETWRTAEWMEQYRLLSPAGKVMNALTERITPQYHLLENSEELKAHPLICIEQQGHYFKLVAGINSDRLERIGVLDKKTKALIAGLGSDRLAWLSDVPVDALVELRGANENESFRKRLTTAISNLHEAALGDVDRIAAEICREIDVGIADHNRAVAEVRSKYTDKGTKWAAAAGVSALGILVPSLAPYLGAALPFALAGTAAWSMIDRSKELRRKSRSLMGVLATTRSAED